MLEFGKRFAQGQNELINEMGHVGEIRLICYGVGKNESDKYFGA